MLPEILKELYTRDINKLKAEIEAYADESDLWNKDGDLPNSAGNLCLHLTGNLRHYFGAVLGGTDYVRDRDAEFAAAGVPRAAMVAEADAALSEVLSVLDQLSDEDMAGTYPLEVFDRPMSTGYFLVHLATHLGYHLGQINYHRRRPGGVQNEL